MSTTSMCQDCGEEPADPGKKVCGWCSDYAEYRAYVARQTQQYELSLLDRELDPGGLPPEPPVEDRLALLPLLAWAPELLQEVGHDALRALVPKRARPIHLHRQRASAALPAGDHPMDAAQVKGQRA